MPVRCADCRSHVCRGGTKEAGPESCPMREGFPRLRDLYAEPSALELLRCASRIEARGYGRWNRVREVGELARALGCRRVGIAHGADTTDEAAKAAAALASFGLDPVLPGEEMRMSPGSQAALFRDQGTELNVVAGMAVPAEMVFLKRSHVPAVVLFARDRRLAHNPVAALYTSRSYLQDALHGHWPKEERPIGPLVGLEALEALLSIGAPEPTSAPQTRLEEAMGLAHGLGTSHLGFTFCVGFKEEARILDRIFRLNGFRVTSVCCKTGATPKEEIGLREDEKIRPGRPEMICNPVAQAELLNREGVQLAFVLGQCVGHDAATLRHLKAPAACLVAKDRVLAHNPVGALR